MLGDLIMKESQIRRAANADLRKFSNFIKHRMQNELYISICDMVVNQAFFRTEKGYIGIGPPNIQVSDEARVTVVASLGHFSFIGDAYVDGIMDGQCVIGSGEEKAAVLLV
jgi:hypothetical protein